MKLCEYKQDDNGISYCMQKGECEYQNLTIIKESHEKIGNEYVYNKYQNCTINESNIKLPSTIESKLSFGGNQVSELGIADLCTISKEDEAKLELYRNSKKLPNQDAKTKIPVWLSSTDKDDSRVYKRGC